MGAALMAIFSTCALLICALLVTRRYRKQTRGARRLLGTRTSMIRGCPGGQVEILGRITPSEQGVFRAPFSGRPAVWARVRVFDLNRGHRRGAEREPIVDEVICHQFLVSDGSGELARVMPQAAEVAVDPREIAGWRTAGFPAAPIASFLAEREIKTTGFLGFRRLLVCEEAALVSGEPIYVVGPAQRNWSQNELQMFAQAGDGGELYITNQSEPEVAAKVQLHGMMNFGIPLILGFFAFFWVIVMLVALLR
jgi:hypothetical protein